MNYWFQTRWFLCEFPIGSYVKLNSAVQPSWSEGGTTRHNFGRGPSNDYFIKVWFQLSNWFQTRWFLCEVPLGSYVKLSLAVAAILVGGLKCRKQFWKGTTQGSFQQSLVEIGSVVSEENLFFIFIPLFSIFSLAAILVESRDHRTQFWKGAMQRPFHQSVVAIGPVVSEKKIFMWISHRVLC